MAEITEAAAADRLSKRHFFHKGAIECKICKCWLNGPDQYDEHRKRRQHEENMRSLKRMARSKTKFNTMGIILEEGDEHDGIMYGNDENPAVGEGIRTTMSAAEYICFLKSQADYFYLKACLKSKAQQGRAATAFGAANGSILAHIHGTKVSTRVALQNSKPRLA